LKLVILVCSKDSTLRKVKEYIAEEYTFLECEMGPKTLQLLKNLVSGIILVDTTMHGILPWIQEACSRRPDLTYLGLIDGQAAVEDSLLPYFYDFIHAPFSSKQVNIKLARAWERVQLRFEMQNLKKAAGDNNGKQELPNHFSPILHKERVLREFSKALSNNFNRNRLLDLFMNAVAELVPVGKLSILLYDENLDQYKIVSQRGLDPQFSFSLRFKSSTGLISWLAGEGRILRIEEVHYAPNGISSAEALQEMKLLQAVACIPLLAHGQLVGILNLGPKITRSSFYEEELEILFTLCGNVAMALRDIALYHQVCDQKSYIESILQRMNSGVVAINREERIITFNFRAGELLKFLPQEVMGKDLRSLPSPLGDLLYETLTTGKAFFKEEIELAPGRIPLEINTYQLLSIEGETFGSVMIFEDITQRKQLEVERRQADRLDVLNKFVGQLAHEIKNPMVAIQTFAELLTEKYDDSSFREFFTYTVRQEIKRLNELVEQLIAFSTPLSYKYSSVDIHETLDMGLLLLQEQGMGQETTVDTAYFGEPLNIRADKTLLARAFSYLLRHCFRAVEVGGIIHIHTFYTDKIFSGGACIRLCDNQTKASIEDVEKMFEPLTAHQNGYISLGLPVSRKIIEDHGGRLKASLTKDKCLEIEVILPIFSGKGG
jgi:nitrogen-specific signal transduction histidine kinase